MKAVVFETFGEPDQVLRTADVPTPAPKSGEVLVRMLASPVNPSDLMTVRGIYGNRPPLPATPGYEGVGIVEAGRGIMAKLLTGRRVAVLNRGGGNWAERVVIPAKQAIPLPADLPLEQAAMFFVNPVTAYVMTRKVLAVPKEAWLLQSAAGSSLGQMVIRLGGHYGFKTLCVVRRADQEAQLMALGADAVAVYDGATDDPQTLIDQVLQITGGAGVRYALDPVGGPTATGIVGCLRDGGRLLVYGTLSGQPAMFNPRDLLTYATIVEGFWLSRWIEAAGLPRRLATVRKVGQLIRQGVLLSDIGQSFPLDDIQQAVRSSEETARGGKVWLRISDETA